LKKLTEIISAEPLSDELEDAPDSSAEVEWRDWQISAQQHDMRLDRALADLVPEFSRSYLQQLIQAGAVTRQGQALTKASSTVKAGESGVIELRPTPQSQAFKPQAMDLSVVFEDEHLRVIHKPAGLVVHPAPGNWSGTLLNGLLALDAKTANLPRAGIVHRLDKDTSGLMVVARTRQTMDALVHMIAQRTVSRQYLAIVHKTWKQASPLDIEAPIGRDPRNRLRMAVVDLSHQAGKTAKTTVALLSGNELGALVKCTLHTGRTHQIRVHLASIGHPLLADAVYDGPPAAGMQRQALHAWQLALTHPITQEKHVWQAALPADMQAALTDWGLGYNAS
jgi:23S rRNA pseudouridine1911/1915/1917 synthase